MQALNVSEEKIAIRIRIKGLDYKNTTNTNRIVYG